MDQDVLIDVLAGKLLQDELLALDRAVIRVALLPLPGKDVLTRRAKHGVQLLENGRRRSDRWPGRAPGAAIPQMGMSSNADPVRTVRTVKSSRWWSFLGACDLSHFHPGSSKHTTPSGKPGTEGFANGCSGGDTASRRFWLMANVIKSKIRRR